MPFSAVELLNRYASYYAGKIWAQQQLGKGKSAVEVAKEVAPETSKLAARASEWDERMKDTSTKRNASWRKKTARLKQEFAKSVGFELNEKTQFRVGRENLPFLLREAPVRILSPYKTFLLNQLKYTIDALSPRGLRTNPKKAIRFAGMTLALAGVAGNPIVYFSFLAINKLLKELWDYDLEEELRRKNLLRGITGKLGLDISGAVAVWLPKTAYELLGRFGKIAVELGKLARAKIEGAGTIMEERKLKRQLYPAQVQRVIDALRILDEKAYVSPIRETPVALTEKPWIAAIKRIAGMVPADVSRTFEHAKAMEKRQARYKSISQDLTERWASAVKSGDSKAMDRVFQRVVNEIDDAVQRIGKAKTEDQVMRALTDLAFYKQWIEQDQKFKNALLRKFIPRQIQTMKKAPSYMKPQAVSSGVGLLNTPSRRSPGKNERLSDLTNFQARYRMAKDMSERVRVKKTLAQYNAKQRKRGRTDLVISWEEVKGKKKRPRAVSPVPSNYKGGLLNYPATRR
jgi:hypothetical protein